MSKKIMYFANPTGKSVGHMLAGVLGYIDTPEQGNSRPDGVTWCADNSCFSDRFDENKWWSWLVKHSGQASSCRFATAPDVVGDAAATLARSLPWLPRIRELGYPVAFVAQDGIESTVVPWDDFDCLFIGGSTEFKLGPVARECASEAKRRGKWLHMGRVNSLKRFRYADSIGCDSVDGTFLVFGPEKNLPRLLSWVTELDERPALFGMTS
jgi:hypothetical protein